MTVSHEMNRTGVDSRGAIVLYLAVVPWYRTECMHILNRRFGDRVQIVAAAYALDPTVRTGIPRELYSEVKRRELVGGRFLATGIKGAVLGADVCVIDLNPRSLSAWLVLIVRRLQGARVLVWGHLHPRAGAGARTAALRRFMRRLADGVIAYDYDGADAARAEIPTQPVWTAPNALYGSADMVLDALTKRTSFVYIGRLVADKNVDQLVPAFEQSGLWRRGYTLEIVGAGELADVLAAQLSGLADEVRASVTLHGTVTGTAAVRRIYAGALCALSPGYIGLNATQSLSFGVPILFSRNEPHAPEIELVRTGAMKAYEDNTIDGLSLAMNVVLEEAESITETARGQLVEYMRSFYSAEAMAGGIAAALTESPNTHLSARESGVVDWFEQ
ncbi:glycosyltransferase [Gordonia sp. OPL2]|uniref:glycosyltransferase n=1 Tax=Gordonia sp. OPL2 TaxID=2486274 RepID=UPI001654D6CF|nr:glycosyltransferase [Gordonia sp. OPL2]ROZ85962.1 glycosyltransferase [Gordonia sp. OPL2]